MKMTPSKIKEAAAVKRRQAAILKIIAAGESMTMTQVEAHFPRLPSGVIRGSVGFMIRLGLLETTPTGSRTKNGNTINAYLVSKKDDYTKYEPEAAPFMLGEVWRGFPRIQSVACVTRSNRLGR